MKHYVALLSLDLSNSSFAATIGDDEQSYFLDKRMRLSEVSSLIQGL